MIAMFDGISYIFGLMSGFLVAIILFAIVEYNIRKERTKKDIQYYEELLSVLDEMSVKPEVENGNT